MRKEKVVGFIKWYLSVPVKAFAVMVVWIIEIRTRVRAKWQAIDFKTVVTGLTLITMIAWVAIYFTADEEYRSTLTDDVKTFIESVE